jgi:antirestriction protein ArdC
MGSSPSLQVLREDNRAIVRAASQASKSADYLLAFLPNIPNSGPTMRTSDACPAGHVDGSNLAMTS